MKVEHRLILGAIVLGLAVAVGDAVLDHLFFYKEPLLDLLVFHVPPHELYVRAVIVASFTGFGVLYSIAAGRHRRTEQALHKASRACRALGECSQALVRAADEEGLLQEICRIIVESCGYRLAWVGFAVESAGKEVRPVAQAGYEAGYLDRVRITWADDAQGRGPTGTAIRTKQPGIARHILTDPDYEPWRAEAARRGYASSIALPLLTDGRALGALNVYAAEADAFDEEEASLLMTLAGDLAYGISALRLRAERGQVESELERHRSQLEELVKERTAELEAVNARLKELDRSRETFIANISHELRMPITNIKLYNYLLATQPDKLAVYLTTLQRETERLERLIDDLLYLSRLDQAEVTLHLMPVVLNSLVDIYIIDRTALAESRGLDLVFEKASDLPTVKADQVQIGQVLGVLLTNALNYTPAGGTVTVRTQAGEFEDKRWVGFSVSDTGPGISSQEQSSLFERFFRGKAGRESNLPGTGLGLAIAKELVDRHDGRIEVESEGVPGKGATFTVWLPVP
jgi:signal transduction histidine kinase